MWCLLVKEIQDINNHPFICQNKKVLQEQKKVARSGTKLLRIVWTKWAKYQTTRHYKVQCQCGYENDNDDSNNSNDNYDYDNDNGVNSTVPKCDITKT